MIGHRTMSPIPATDTQTDRPVTLHRVMQQMIAQGLKTRYEPPAKLSHALFVLLMRLNDNDRRKAKTAGRDNAAVRA
jgi:hypothetical protein